MRTFAVSFERGDRGKGKTLKYSLRHTPMGNVKIC